MTMYKRFWNDVTKSIKATRILVSQNKFSIEEKVNCFMRKPGNN